MPHRYSMRSDKRYLVMTVECTRCKTKQNIHVANRTEVAQKGNEKVPCINCDHRFEVKVPDKFIRGPFPA
jgi:transcription elongation factor Elf1